MKLSDIVSARRQAEEAVSDMEETPLKLKAFEVILSSLLSDPAPKANEEQASRAQSVERSESAISLADRIRVLAQEDFFSMPRSLAEIQNSLAERGWHYAQSNLSTPLIRLVRARQLRRLQVTEGNKRLWKYSLP